MGESMGGLSDSDEEIQLENNELENNEKEGEIKLGPIGYNWMDSMGCMNDIDEEESSPKSKENHSQKNSKPTRCENSNKQRMEQFEQKTFAAAALYLGHIGSSWMETLGDQSGS